MEPFRLKGSPLYTSATGANLVSIGPAVSLPVIFKYTGSSVLPQYEGQLPLLVFTFTLNVCAINETKV